MTPTIESLGIDRLSVADRMTLVERIWDSIVQDSNGLPASSDQLAELERRWQDDEENPDDVVPWDEIRDSARKRWGR